jgi:hypothetical protein
MAARCPNEKRLPRCERLDGMSTKDQETRIQENLKVIRNYLLMQFPWFQIVKDKPFW